MFVITAALRQEISDFKKHLNLDLHVNLSPFHFYQGRLQGKAFGLFLTSVGPKPSELARAWQYVVAQFGVDGALFAGFAGGLAPGQRVGQLVAASEFLGEWSPARREPERLESDPLWFGRVSALLHELALPYSKGSCVTVAAPLFTAAAKETLGRESQAVMVDMESVYLAKCSQAIGIPYVGVRSVFDPMEAELPKPICELVDAQGGFQSGKGFKLLATAPKHLMQLPQFARNAHQARRSLAQFLLHFVAKELVK